MHPEMGKSARHFAFKFKKYLSYHEHKKLAQSLPYKGMDIIKTPQHLPLYLKYWYVIPGALALVVVSKYRNVSFIAGEDSPLIETVQQQVAVAFENPQEKVANLTLHASADGIVQEMHPRI